MIHDHHYKKIAFLAGPQASFGSKIREAVGIAVRYVLTAGFTAMCTAVLILPVGIDTIVNGDKTEASSNPDLVMYSPLTFIKMFLMGDPRPRKDHTYLKPYRSDPFNGFLLFRQGVAGIRRSELVLPQTRFCIPADLPCNNPQGFRTPERCAF